ncbi:MAG: bifunctional DNA-formamidopyrimidine glycosylase/DNA-(apurinic or apyrimidinic site) lyase [Gammaproteobacteria bacterium]
MPELPEVETVRRGIAGQLRGKCIDEVIVRCRRLRLPVDKNLRARLVGKTVLRMRRRGKYLIFDLDGGAVVAHLGMSGVFYFSKTPPQNKHEHIALQIGGQFLIYHDPRRFGCFVWHAGAPDSHPLLRNLGAEPLSAKFNGALLCDAWKGRAAPVKTALLDGRAVAGIGNIYAAESLHLARIRPQTPAGKISAARAEKLAAAIKQILQKALRAGGSTLRNFSHPDGAPGHFQMQWKVYGRAGKPCACGGAIKKITQSGRATYYCPRCQK